MDRKMKRKIKELENKHSGLPVIITQVTKGKKITVLYTVSLHQYPAYYNLIFSLFANSTCIYA